MSEQRSAVRNDLETRSDRSVTSRPLVLVVAQDMLDQYGPHDSKLSSLDSALKDAVQMVRVSDQRITYLRKMHALLLLKRCGDYGIRQPLHSLLQRRIEQRCSARGRSSSAPPGASQVGSSPAASARPTPAHAQCKACCLSAEALRIRCCRRQKRRKVSGRW